MLITSAYSGEEYTQLTTCNDNTASVFSCAYNPKRKMGRLYVGAANGLMANDKTCPWYRY